MDNDIHFSIIIPTYNRGLILRRTVLALLNQQFKNFEIVVVDDGSTDNTKEIISSINHPSLFYHKIANRERGAARNYGTQKARGQYLNFFDSDDLAYNIHLDHAISSIQENNTPDVFALSYHVVDENGKITKEVLLHKNVAQFICEGNHLSCNGVFIKREIALAHPFNEDRALSGSEDYELWLRLAARFTFPCFPSISHAVVQHSGRSTNNFKPEPLILRKEKMIEFAFQDEKVRAKFGVQKQRMISGAEAYIALHLALGKSNKKEALEWWIKSVRTAPVTFASKRSLAILKNLLFV